MPGIIQRIRTRINTMFIRCQGAAIGKGSVVNYSVEIQNPGGIMMGMRSTIYKNVSIFNGKSGSFKFGNYSHIAPFGYFLIDNNFMSVGDHVAIGPFCAFFCHSNDFSDSSDFFTDSYLDGDIIIGSNVFIGAQCTVLPGSVISDNVVIGANSVVKGHLESGFMYAGSPARKIKPISESND